MTEGLRLEIEWKRLKEQTCVCGATAEIYDVYGLGVVVMARKRRKDKGGFWVLGFGFWVWVLLQH